MSKTIGFLKYIHQKGRYNLNKFAFFRKNEENQEKRIKIPSLYDFTICAVFNYDNLMFHSLNTFDISSRCNKVRN